MSVDPTEPIYTCLLICERIITDAQDGVHSAIRAVDLYNVSPSDIPSEKRPLPLSILFLAKFPNNDETEHKVDIKLERPNGEVLDVGTSELKKLSHKYPEAPKGLNLAVRFGVLPLMMGVHYIVIDLDGKRVERAPFTLREQPAKEEQNSQSE